MYNFSSVLRVHLKGEYFSIILLIRMSHNTSSSTRRNLIDLQIMFIIIFSAFFVQKVEALGSLQFIIICVTQIMFLFLLHILRASHHCYYHEWISPFMVSRPG